jgi:hypothetical protein
MTRLVSMLLAATLFPVAALADTCPWLDAKVAAEVILVTPTHVKLEKNPVLPNAGGMVSATTCLFKGADEGLGQLSVIVMEYASEGVAKASYEKELKSQASRARPSKLDGNAAFFTMTPGFSGGSFAVKGKRIVFVSHVFSKRVKESIATDPDGAVLSTHEIARQVLAKL